ncbi:MAG TPA: DUF4386 domain-containing protein [Blastocatellia bacterium]|nr:DUF4386 domain-containing protein [Blastocatellia bacterium]
MNSTRKTARIAGLLYLLMAVAATFSLNIPSGFIVRGDAAATADKIASSQLFYRLCVVSDLVSQILFVFLVLVLYQLLKGVNKRQAALMVALVLVQVPMAFTNMLVGMVPLVLLNGADYWSVFDKHQMDALTMGSLSLRSYGINAVWALCGLWLLPFGLLIFRSGFIPRILGVILIVGCFADLAISVTSLLFPAYEQIVSKLTILGAGDLLIILWLLIKGVRVQPLDEQAS